ncbi:MAG: dihydrofolate reductase [Crocinitomicaceae bacterium]
MIKLIVAKSTNNVIGKDNDLIWNLPADMKFFSTTTKGNIVVMGRKNWESIPNKYRPLPERLNLVVSRDTSFSEPGCESFTSIEEAISAYEKDPRDIFIIGGGQIYAYCLRHGLVDEMLITEIDHSFEGDTFFPDFDQSEWNKELLLKKEKDDKNPYPFSIWKYTKKR